MAAQEEADGPRSNNSNDILDEVAGRSSKEEAAPNQKASNDNNYQSN